jgi:hypothetical protein
VADTASCPGAGAGRKTQLGCPTIARILRDQLAMGGKGAAYPELSWFLFLRPVEPSGARRFSQVA